MNSLKALALAPLLALTLAACATTTSEEPEPEPTPSLPPEVKSSGEWPVEYGTLSEVRYNLANGQTVTCMVLYGGDTDFTCFPQEGEAGSPQANNMEATEVMSSMEWPVEYGTMSELEFKLSSGKTTTCIILYGGVSRLSCLPPVAR